jgi:hypothetical protein
MAATAQTAQWEIVKSAIHWYHQYPGLRMISRIEFSFEPQDRDLMIESAIIDSR